MTNEELEEWKSCVTARNFQSSEKTYSVDHKDEDNQKPKFIRFEGETNTFQSLRVALNFARTDKKERKLNCVLFAFSIRNYRGFTGVRQESEDMKGEEILLKDGAPMFVLGVQEVPIRNT